MESPRRTEYIFVSFAKSYSDEFYIYGQVCLAERDWNTYYPRVKSNFQENAGNPLYGYFGTNQFLVFHTLEEWESCKLVTKVSKDFYTSWNSLSCANCGLGYHASAFLDLVKTKD